MRVLKVVAEGLTASFRYPHFMHGIQPTFEMPPPATIYGHICSAMGEWVSPEGMVFAYHFTHHAKFEDVEHIHVLSTKTGEWPKKKSLESTGWKYPVSVGGSINPFKRELLFKPRLILYLNRPEWQPFFESPRYPVVLGRSQDLFIYTAVEVIDLQESERVYFEHTLVPYRMAMQMGRGYAVLMPRYLDYEKGRVPTYARYLILNHRVHSRDLLRFENEPIDKTYYADPTTSDDHSGHLGLLFHGFLGDGDTPDMA